MIANRQHADLASAFMEAWDRGDHWRAAIRTSIATYHDDFQSSFRAELTKGVTELGSNPITILQITPPTRKSLRLAQDDGGTGPAYRSEAAGAADNDVGIGMLITRPARIAVASHVHDHRRDRHVVSRLAVRWHRENDDAGRRVIE